MVVILKKKKKIKNLRWLCILSVFLFDIFWSILHKEFIKFYSQLLTVKYSSSLLFGFEIDYTKILHQKAWSII